MLQPKSLKNEHCYIKTTETKKKMTTTARILFFFLLFETRIFYKTNGTELIEYDTHAYKQLEFRMPKRSIGNGGARSLIMDNFNQDCQLTSSHLFF
jgi:hypothetical protein